MGTGNRIITTIEEYKILSITGIGACFIVIKSNASGVPLEQRGITIQAQE